MIKVNNPIITFIILSYLLISATFYGLFNGELPTQSGASSGLETFLIMLTPTFAYVITAKIYKEPLLTKKEIFGELNFWLIVSLIAPLILMIITAAVSISAFPLINFNSNLTGMVEYNDSIPVFFKNEMLDKIKANPLDYLLNSIFQGLNSGWGLSMLFAFGEEIGWRGYFLKKLGKTSIAKASLIIGPIWGLWHAPLILKGYNYPTNPVLGVPMMMLACTALTPMMIFLRKKAKSIWAPAIFHGSFNSLGGISIIPLMGKFNSFEAGFLGISGILACLIIYFLYFLFKNYQDKKINNLLFLQKNKL